MTSTYDVVICGGGGAGLSAAIEAHDSGARVVVLERADAIGGNTFESGGSLATVHDEERAVDHYVALTEGRTPREVVAAYVRGLVELPDWIRANGSDVEEQSLSAPAFPPRHAGSAYADLPGSDAIGGRVKVVGDSHGGTALGRFLTENVERRDIEIRLNSRVVELVTTGDRVTGVVVEGGETIEATRGVILTTGGFAWDPDMVKDFLGIEMPSFSPPHRNAGDGIRLAQSVGAGLWHMNAVAAALGYVISGYEAAWMCKIHDYGFLVVDQYTSRFMNETALEQHASAPVLGVRDLTSGAQVRNPSYLIFDDVTRRSGPIATREVGANRVFDWSEDNSVEVENGWIHKADSLDELAAALGIDAGRLAEEVEAYNGYAQAAGDPFDRPPSKMRALEAPYYGIEIRPSLLNTQGGPRRNGNAQVMSAMGEPIEGLYSAGELGSLWAELYPGAGNVGEAVVVGRIAGGEASRA